MGKKAGSNEKFHHNRLFIASLTVSALAIALSNTTLTLLLLEIASTFQVQEGIAAQLRTVNCCAELVFALLMGFLALRFKHKSLLLFGLLLVAVSAAGTFFSPTLSVMMIFFFMEGSGTAMVMIMILTVVGDTLPLNEKNKAVMWIVIAGFISILAGTPLINFIAGTSSWRYVFLLLVLSISVAGLILASFSISPQKAVPQQFKIEKSKYLHHFKQILLNRSADSYLVSFLLFTGAGNPLFVIAFFRQNFALKLEYVVYLILVSALLYIISSLITNKLGNKLGIKYMTIIGALGSGIFLIFMFFATNLWMAMILNFVQAFLTGMALSAYPCLALDQVPNSRSTMISFTRIFGNIGNTIVPAIGGALLVFFSTQPIGIGYQAVGLTFGIMNITAAVILSLLTKDPNRLKNKC